MHPMRPVRMTPIALALSGLLVAGCALGPVPDGTSSPTGQSSRSGPALERVSPQDAARLRRVVEPLAKAADRPPAKVTVGILSDPSINAANAGGGEFYVTRGLLESRHRRAAAGDHGPRVRAQRSRPRGQGAASSRPGSSSAPPSWSRSSRTRRSSRPSQER